MESSAEFKSRMLELSRSIAREIQEAADQKIEGDPTTQARLNKILFILNGGGSIAWEYITGGLIVVNPDSSRSNLGISSTEKDYLLRNNLIKQTGSMREGHPYFRGSVIIYGKA